MRTIASEIKKLSEYMHLASINPVIEYTMKSNYGNKPLVYVISEHKDALKNLTGTKTLTDYHVDALKKLGFEFKEK